MLRLFVGIPLPPERRLTLSAICAGIPGLRWVEPGNYHVTIRFIGEIDEGLAEEVHEALGAIRAGRFALSIAGLGYFGAAEKPRTVYAAVERSAGLLQLRDRVEATLVRQGLVVETRRYTPHVTLATAKSPDPGDIHRFIEANNLLRLPPFDVAAFHLIRSYLTKAGSIYEEVAEYPLRQH